jgi:metal-dependent hydrolase (beta-lactamase superfamily II)
LDHHRSQGKTRLGQCCTTGIEAWVHHATEICGDKKACALGGIGWCSVGIELMMRKMDAFTSSMLDAAF